jgi:hypothetical protein
MAKQKVSSIDKPILEKSKIMAVSLRESEADEIKMFASNSLTKGIRECHDAAKLVKELGGGSLEKGKRKLIAVLDKMAAKGN